MKKLLLAAAIACAPTLVFAADASGAYTINGAFASMGVNYSITCTLKDDGTGKVSGPCTGGGQPDAAATGTISSTAFEVTYPTTYQGTPVTLDYKGTIAADGSISGTIDTGGPQGTFTASKK